MAKKPATALASRKLQRTSSQPGQRKGLTTRLAVSATLLTLISCYAVVSELTLSPVYGANQAPSRGHIFPIVAFIFGLLLRKISPTTSAITILQFIPLHHFTVPSILHYVILPYGPKLGPSFGMFVAQTVSLFPLLLLSFYVIVALIDDMGVLGNGGTGDEVGFLAITYLAFYCLKTFAAQVLPGLMGRGLFFTRWGLHVFLASCFAVLLPIRKLAYIFPGLVPALGFSLFQDVHAPFGRSLTQANAMLARHELAILDRQESKTGYISVVQSLRGHFRVLRCDHSLLGGIWLATEGRAADGITVPETIYTVFTMLEAVRLMEYHTIAAPSEPLTALVLGLGIGTSPAALTAHGIDTTAVELDPVVTRFAQQYFDLPANLTVVNDDARRFLRRDRTLYDMIIHDVFTGGIEPVNMFTADFLVLIKKSLKPSGRVAINYVGDPSALETLLVLSGIDVVFEGCRYFTDEPLQDSDASQIVNIVTFCTNEPQKWHFREPVEADFLKSQSRRHYLLPKHEIFPIKETESGKHPAILNNFNTHVIEAKHPEQARRHWEVMRGVLPAEVWELW